MQSSKNTTNPRRGTALAPRQRRSQSKYDAGSTVDTRMGRAGERLRFYLEVNHITGRPRWQHMEPGRMLEILKGIIDQARYSKNADEARKIIDQIKQKQNNHESRF